MNILLALDVEHPLAVANEVAVGGHTTQRHFAITSALDALANPEGPQLVVLAFADERHTVRWCQQIREANHGRYVYILAVCAGGADNAAAVLSAGADDYVLFPYASGELAVRIEVAKRILNSNSTEARSRCALESLASCDPLTGLLSRRRLLADIESAMKKSQIANTPLSCLLLDVDHFKRINDTHGHLVGDEVLQRVAGVLQLAANDGDLVYRYGGDEFLLLMPGSDQSQAVAAAERMRSQIVFVGALMERQPMVLTASIGAAESFPQLESASHFLQLADGALMQAKRAGRDCTMSAAMSAKKERAK